MVVRLQEFCIYCYVEGYKNGGQKVVDEQMYGENGIFVVFGFIVVLFYYGQGENIECNFKVEIYY